MSQPNSKLTEILELVSGTLTGGEGSPYSFANLITNLLLPTIAKKTEFVKAQQSSVKNKWVIAPHKRPTADMLAAADGSEVYKCIELNNGRYLAIEFDVFLDPKDNFLKVIRSKMGYQLDDFGHKEIFRYDYARFPKTDYAFSHLHVYGDWKHKDAPPTKDLPKVHFPVVRSTLESCIRLLINDFAIPTNETKDIYEPLLKASEDGFLRVARTGKKQEKDYPD